ncbi:hypothetical protein CIB84_008270 [Bambusicola thoracicus]|uniref:Interleukin-3 n=1 Tax=Bambusicola thoracicus TaxID=9083 RepID=A0A2P4SV49_BAMTH|nr:hypothetical protein CIB84_008270 [Bambusicola thoracicus]
MLAQLTVLLALGVLCSPAPITTHSLCSAACSIIQEEKSVVERGLTLPDLSSIPMVIRDKTCMRNNLNTFIESLKANPENNGTIIQLKEVYKCEHLFPKVTPTPQVPDKECRTAQVSRNKFKKEFGRFLDYLYEVLKDEPNNKGCTKPRK